MLLIIDNYDSFTYNLYQAVSLFHSDVRVVRNDKITLADIQKLNPQGIILSPGPGRPEDAGICIPLIQAMVNNQMAPTPLLGVCLGHQAITIALGGRVIQSPEIMHGKDDFIFHHHTGIYAHLSHPFKAGRYHSLIAERATLPQDLIIQAENSNQLIMGLSHASLPIYGVQFHPESILTPEGPKLLAAFVKIAAGAANQNTINLKETAA
jgi:anthranilate synthase component II